MIRKQVYIKPLQQKQLKNLAQLRNVSEAEVIRLAIDSFIEANHPVKINPLYALVGLCKESAPSDLAEYHDLYLAGKNDADQR